MSQDYINELIKILVPGTIDTIYMVGLSSLFSVIFGIFFGLLLYITDHNGLTPMPIFNQVLGTIVNVGRSIPFIIIIFAVFPLSRFIVGASIGKTAAIVPLTIAAIPFMARLIEVNFTDLGKGIIEAALASGASTFQIITKVLIPETAQGIVMNITVTIINLIGCSAMAGAIGGGGLGDVATRYGFQRFRNDILILTIILLIIMVQIIQVVGNMIRRRLDKR